MNIPKPNIIRPVSKLLNATCLINRKRKDTMKVISKSSAFDPIVQPKSDVRTITKRVTNVGMNQLLKFIKKKKRLTNVRPHTRGRLW